MTITAEIVKDSVGPNGVRITTMLLTYPRFIHAEFMTHRVFSRNASSSRAIPVNKIIEAVKTNPAMPVFWGKNQAGMQAAEELEGTEKEVAIQVWLGARDRAVAYAEALVMQGVHKQIANRVLEPFSHITVVVTATEWSNFFALRLHKAAQPEIRVLAEEMKKAMDNSLPVDLFPGMWHLPFVSEMDIASAMLTDMLAGKEFDWTPYIKQYVARCARTSYLNHDKTQTTQEQDDQLYERLVGAQPIHASPAEHQAMALSTNDVTLSGNFYGWIQYRKTIPGENA